MLYKDEGIYKGFPSQTDNGYKLKINNMKTYPDDNTTSYGYASQYSTYERRGLTKREYFAAIAMQGILSSKIQTDSVFVANYAVEYADALIEALNKNL